MGSLLGGVLALLIFRRGVPHVAWIVGYLILLWLLFTLYTLVRRSLEKRGRRFVITAVDYTIQTLLHGLLLFILPGYFASTTFTSVNVWFFLLLVGLALLTTVDPWYRGLVLPRRWAIYVLFGVSIFAALNVALPLVGVRPARALFGSAALGGLALTPTLGRLPYGSWRSAWLRSCLFAALALAIVWPLRSFIPPAPVHLARATMARTVNGLEPAEPFRGTISLADLRSWGGLVAYTAVYAPAGVRQPILHIWRKDGQPVDTISLSPIRGGRTEGFRTYSRKTSLGADAAGRWSVDVVTASGQLIGRLRFTVRP
ncbi:MAG: DUF5924 family protein [Candidatus Methylomirabilia bacterium]